MKSGVPWHVIGVGQEAQETAQAAARRSGKSVGEWLDSVIIDSAQTAGVPDKAGVGDDAQYPDHARPRRRSYSDHDERHRRHAEDELDEVHDRLDALYRQLDRVENTSSRSEREREQATSRQFADAVSRIDRRLDQLISGAAFTAPAMAARPGPPARPQAGVAADPPTPLDQALMEIAERQRTLDSDAAPPIVPRADVQRAPTQGLTALEQQLRTITDHIETMRPCGIEGALETLRDDLAEIGLMIKEAMPRRAVEALEHQARALAERIDSERGTAVDATALAGLERGLAEVRDALRGLTPAENLVGFEEAVKGLAQKIDRLGASNHEPAALKQLESAVLALRGITSHVASDDSLAQLSAEVQRLAAKVDQVAGSGDLLSNLERSITTIADALQSRNHAGQETRDLEIMIRGLSEKFERLSLTGADHAAVDGLEGRIAKLVEKLDASDSRLNHLPSIERGLADLLIHLEHQREPQLARSGAEIDALKRDVLKTQDSLESVHGTIGQVVDRIATIEDDIRAGQKPPADLPPNPAPPAFDPPATPPPPPAASPPPPPAAQEMTAVNLPPPAMTADEGPAALAAAPSAAGNPAPTLEHERRPIDPDLPPDHPIEPGATRTRGSSPADRIAASEAALGPAKPPVIPDPGGKSNFIAAARRAAKAAASEAPAPMRAAPAAKAVPLLQRLAAGLGQRVRSVLVVGSVAIIVLGSLHVMVSLLRSSDAPDAGLPLPAAQTPSSGETPATDQQNFQPNTPDGRQSLLTPALDSILLPTPGRSVAPADTAQQPVGNPAARDRDVTGATDPVLPVPLARPVAADKLPPPIVSSALRTAALKGNPAAEYEIGLRYAEGRGGVAQNFTDAADWFERAAKQGLVPAQFRLGGLYEKGLGVKKDLEIARRHYLAAAQAGHAKAMHNLAVLYAEGIDGKPDYAQAARWFRKSADHGTSDSQYNLGILYARGIGVETNLAESYKWFTLAGREGDPEAARKRDEVGARLDAQSLTAARLAAQTWVAEPQPEAATEVKAPAGGWDGALAPSQTKRRVGSKTEPSAARR